MSYSKILSLTKFGEYIEKKFCKYFFWGGGGEGGDNHWSKWEMFKIKIQKKIKIKQFSKVNQLNACITLRFFYEISVLVYANSVIFLLLMSKNSLSN